jgi:hypothetical protein
MAISMVIIGILVFVLLVAGAIIAGMIEDSKKDKNN